MRYILQASNDTPGWWVVTDTENKVVVKFKDHEFNDTQKVTLLEDCHLSALQAARIMRELSDWLAAEHYDKAF